MTVQLERVTPDFSIPPLPAWLDAGGSYGEVHETWAFEQYEAATTPVDSLEALADMSLSHAWQIVAKNGSETVRQYLGDCQKNPDATEANVWENILYAGVMDSPIIQLH